jgi:DNA-binding NtrC family response regulator
MICLEHLPATVRKHVSGPSLAAPPDDEEPVLAATSEQPRKALAQARQMGEYRYLMGVLDKCQNNRSEAARLLGISRTALYKKLGSLGIN